MMMMMIVMTNRQRNKKTNNSLWLMTLLGNFFPVFLLFFTLLLLSDTFSPSIPSVGCILIGCRTTATSFCWSPGRWAPCTPTFRCSTPPSWRLSSSHRPPLLWRLLQNQLFQISQMSLKFLPPPRPVIISARTGKMDSVPTSVVSF